jgi:capsid protein
VKEIQAAMLEIDAGLNSRQRIVKELGLDLDELREEQAADMKARELAKLPELFSTMSREATPEPIKEPPNANANPD